MYNKSNLNKSSIFKQISLFKGKKIIENSLAAPSNEDERLAIFLESRTQNSLNKSLSEVNQA